MTFSPKVLFTPATALAFLALTACGGDDATTSDLPPSPAMTTDTVTPKPPGTLPEAPPEQIAPSPMTPDPADPIDGQQLPPGRPPPVLPPTPPT